MTKAQTKERADAIAQLRNWIKPGDTVYTICDHVSASGMSRHIRVVLLDHCGENGRGCSPSHPNWAVGKAIGARHARRNGRELDALLIQGCGMDMGFHVVYELSHVLYGSGYACLGKGACPSNYHVNHRAQVRCQGVEGRFCWAPGRVNAETYDGRHRINSDDDPFELCPTCDGKGYVTNPEGPERFDLVHTDGYALRHRWL